MPWPPQRGKVWGCGVGPEWEGGQKPEGLKKAGEGFSWKKGET